MSISVFEVTKKSFGQQQVIDLRNTKTQEYVSILPEMGGMLFSFELEFNGKLIPLLDTYKSEKELIETLGNSYKGSNLVPFPNRIDGGKYSFEGKENQLEVNFPNENNAIHGLIYNKPMHIIKDGADDDSAFVELMFKSDRSLKGYPYKFELIVKYSFSEKDGLTIESRVTNTDSINIPFGIGWHPYFIFSSQVNELEFSFPSEVLFEVNERMLPTGKTNVYKEFNLLKEIKDTSFDTCFRLNTEEGIAETKLINKKLNAGYSVWQETGNNKYNFLQIYTPDHRESVAIEPMTCIPNAFNSENSFTILKPNELNSVSWGVCKI